MNFKNLLTWHSEYHKGEKENSVEEILSLGWIDGSMRKAWKLVV